MSSRIIWIISAVVAAAILIPVSMSGYEDWQVYSRGSLVVVHITRLPSARSGFLKFTLNGRPYDKSVSQRFNNNLNIGDSIRLKYFSGAANRFLWPDENPVSGDLAAIVILFSSLIACIVYASRRVPPEATVFRRP